MRWARWALWPAMAAAGIAAEAVGLGFDDPGEWVPDLVTGWVLGACGLVAWERRLEVPSVNDPRVQQFIDAYAGGKQAPEPNQACEGVGQPAS